MSWEEWHEKRRVVREELYTLLDRGLDKKSATQLIEIIEELIDLRLEKPSE